MKIDLTKLANKAVTKSIERIGYKLVELRYTLNYALGTHTKGYKHTKHSEKLDPLTLEFCLKLLDNTAKELYGEKWEELQLLYWIPYRDEDMDLSKAPVLQAKIKIE